MRAEYVQSLRRVTVTHFVLIAAICVVSALPPLFLPRKPVSIPLEFVVEVPAGDRDVLKPLPAPTPAPTPDQAAKTPEVAIKTPIVIPDKVPRKPSKSPAATNAAPRKITRKAMGGGTSNRKSELTEQQIRELLLQGAKPSDHTSIPPDVETRCYALIKQALYDAWNQPSIEEAGNATVDAFIRFGPGGMIVERGLRRDSGRMVLDKSVNDALRAVNRIEGLTPEFLADHETVTILFKVEDDGGVPGGVR